MTRRLLASYVSLALAVVLLLGVPLGLVTARGERRHLVDQLRRDALALALLVEAPLRGASGADVGATARDYARRTGARVVVVDARGRGVADSERAPGTRLGSYANRPEVAAALRGEEAHGVRRSETLDRDLLYVAVPVATGGRLHGALRLTYPVSVVEDRIRRTWALLAVFALTVLAATSAVSLGLARSFARPLRELGAAARRLGAGELAARVAVPRQPAEARVLAEAFNETAAKLAGLVEAQQAFVADASHQLRSPLAALRLRLENLEPDVTGAGRADLDGALAEVRRLSRLVDGLLALARTSGEATTRVPVDLAAVVAERQAAWTPYAEERGVRLAVAVEGGPVALATPGHPEQVVDNLLANALDVAPGGTAVSVVADVDADVDGGWARLQVVDAGPGMSEEERARAFERFWRSPAARARGGGSGLGLAIVRELLRADGGRAELAPADGGGLRAVARWRSAGGSG